MLKRYYQKKKKKKEKKSFQKRLVNGIKIFLTKKNIKSANMLVSDIKCFLKEKKKCQYGCK